MHQYKRSNIEFYPSSIKEVKKNYVKTERHKFKHNDNEFGNLDMNTITSARENMHNRGLVHFDSTNNKWTVKSKESENRGQKEKCIEDFEKLFYQSMGNEKGKVISQKGVDFATVKSFKSQYPNHYRSLSKHKNAKHIKNKKSIKNYDPKAKKSKKISPSGIKYKSRCTSKVNKYRPPPTDESSK